MGRQVLRGIGVAANRLHSTSRMIWNRRGAHAGHQVKREDHDRPGQGVLAGCQRPRKFTAFFQQTASALRHSTARPR